MTNRATRRDGLRPATPPAQRGARAQRVVAAMAFTLIGLSALAVVALLILTATGVERTAFGSGGLLVLQILPLPGLTIGLLLIVVLLVMGIVSRRRANRR